MHNSVVIQKDKLIYIWYLILYQSLIYFVKIQNTYH